jgi:hypothetical protein
MKRRYKNNTVQATWSSGVEDPGNFRIQMQQPSGENVTLADTGTVTHVVSLARCWSCSAVPTSLQALTLGLPQLADGDGYLIRFVNVSDTTQIYAESQPFEVAQGICMHELWEDFGDLFCGWILVSGIGILATTSSGITSASSTIAIPGPYTVSWHGDGCAWTWPERSFSRVTDWAVFLGLSGLDWNADSGDGRCDFN